MSVWITMVAVHSMWIVIILTALEHVEPVLKEWKAMEPFVNVCIIFKYDIHQY